MAAPATQGRLCTSLSEMEIGDYIKWHYKADSANTAGEFTDISSGGGAEELNLEELPTTPGSTANGSFYFLKVDKGLLVADRRVQAAISASSLNQKNYFSGGYSQRGIIRILTVDEWVKYITNGTCEGKTSLRDPAVWNIPATHVLQKEQKTGVVFYTELVQYLSGTTIKTEYSMSRINYDGSHFLSWWYLNPQVYSAVNIYAGFTATVNPMSYGTAHPVHHTPYICFRPAMEYIDNPNSKNIWY